MKRIYAAVLTGLLLFLYLQPLYAQDSSADRISDIYGASGDLSRSQEQKLREVEQLLAEKKYDQAMKLTDKYLASDVSHYPLHLLKADLISASDTVQSGIDYLTALIAKRPKDGMLFLLRGIFLYKNQYYSSAADNLIESGLLKKGLGRAHYYLYLIRSDENRQTIAATEIKKAVAADPKNHLYHYLMGRTQMRLGKTEEAVSALREAVKLNPDEVIYARFLGEVLLHENDTDAVSRYFEEQLKHNPEDEWTISRYVSFLLGNDNITDAEKFIDDGLKKYPDNPVYIQNKGVIYAEKGLYADALPQFERSLELKPDLTIVKIQLYRAYWALGKYDKAETILEELTAAKIRDVIAYIYLARVYNFQNRIYSAEEVILSGLELDPENQHLLYEYSQVLYKRKRFKESVSILKALSEKYSRNINYYGELGIIYSRTADYKNAAEYLKKAADVADNDRYLYYLADSLYYLKDIGGLYQLEKTRTKDPMVKGFLFYQTARLESVKFMTRRSAGSINKALSADEDNPAYLGLEAHILSNMKQYSAAFASIDKAIKRSPSSVYKKQRISLLMALKQDKQALKEIQDLKKIIEPDLFLLLAEDYLNGQTFFKQTRYKDRRFKFYYEKLMRSASHDENYWLLKRMSKEYRPYLLEIFSSKFSLPLSEIDVKSSYENAESMNREEALVFLFGKYKKTVFNKETAQLFIRDTDRYTQKYGQNIYIDALKADALVQSEKYSQARDVLESFGKQFPESLWAKTKLAYVYDFMREYKKAEDIYGELLTENPNNALVLNNLAWMYVTAKDKNMLDTKKALEYVDKAIRIVSTPEYLDTKAEVLYLMGQHKEALALIEQALSADDSDADHFKKQRRKILNALKKPGTPAGKDEN